MAWSLSPRGFSPQAADSVVVREGFSDGVPFELRSKGLEGSSEQANGGEAAKREGNDL